MSILIDKSTRLIVQGITGMASPARTETGRKDGAAVLIVITKHSVRNTAIRRKALPSN